MSVFNVVSFQEEISPTGQFLVQRSLSECIVSECYRESSVMWWPWPTRAYYVIKKFVFDYVRFVLLSRDSFVR
jgi:hypothetical protein